MSTSWSGFATWAASNPGWQTALIPSGLIDYAYKQSTREERREIDKAERKAAEQRREDAKKADNQRQTAEKRAKNADKYLGNSKHSSLAPFGDLQNSIEVASEKATSNIKMGVIGFIAIMVVLLIAVIVFKSVAVKQRRDYLKRN